MDRSKRWWRSRVTATRRDDGAALVEFIALALVLLIPLIYLIFSVARVQAGALAAESAARDAARSAVVAGVAAIEDGQSPSEATVLAVTRANAMSALVIEDFGFDATTDATVSIECSSSPCFAQGSTVYSSADVRVTLPGIPGFVTSRVPLHVTVNGTAASPVDGLAVN